MTHAVSAMKNVWRMAPLTRSERSKAMKELLKWLNAKTKSSHGARRSEIVRHVVVEITELGATQRAIVGYLDTLVTMGFISIHGNKYLLTSVGENWLEKKVS